MRDSLVIFSVLGITSILISIKVNVYFRERYFILMFLFIIWNDITIKLLEIFTSMEMIFIIVFLHLLCIPIFLFVNEIVFLVWNIREKKFKNILLSVLVISSYIGLIEYIDFTKDHSITYFVLKGVIVLLMTVNYYIVKKENSDDIEA